MGNLILLILAVAFIFVLPPYYLLFQLRRTIHRRLLEPQERAKLLQENVVYLRRRLQELDPGSIDSEEPVTKASVRARRQEKLIRKT